MWLAEQSHHQIPVRWMHCHDFDWFTVCPTEASSEDEVRLGNQRSNEGNSFIFIANFMWKKVRSIRSGDSQTPHCVRVIYFRSMIRWNRSYIDFVARKKNANNEDIPSTDTLFYSHRWCGLNPRLWKSIRIIRRCCCCCCSSSINNQMAKRPTIASIKILDLYAMIHQHLISHSKLCSLKQIPANVFQMPAVSIIVRRANGWILMIAFGICICIWKVHANKPLLQGPNQTL